MNVLGGNCRRRRLCAHLALASVVTTAVAFNVGPCARLRWTSLPPSFRRQRHRRHRRPSHRVPSTLGNAPLLQLFMASKEGRGIEDSAADRKNQIYGLTDDGDFCLSGINHSQQSEESNDLSNGQETDDANPNLLDASIFDYLSKTSEASSRNAGSSNPLGGVDQDDGYHPKGLGKTTATRSTVPSNTAPESPVATGEPTKRSGETGTSPSMPQQQRQQRQPSTGTSVAAPSFSQSSASARSVSASSSATASPPAMQQQQVHQQPEQTAGDALQHLGHPDKDELDQMKAWLLGHIPTLKDGTCDVYAQNLCTIGFEPDCVTQCELTFDDLSFMKMLHQRYIYRVITGGTHPSNKI